MLLLGIPPSILCGIDLLSFTTSANFHGIKDVPPGYHFIFTSETSSFSIRNGFWFYVPESYRDSKPALTVRKWDAETACLVAVQNVESFRPALNHLWERGLSPYRQSAERELSHDSGDWSVLTAHVSPSVLSHLTKADDWGLTSASCAEVDQDRIPGLDAGEMAVKEQDLGVLGIDLKRTWREGAVGRERTDAATDRSWALDDLLRRWQGTQSSWGDVVLGQMEACFVMVLTIANFSCLEEWKRCLQIILTCTKAVREHEDFFSKALNLLSKQIQRFEDVDGGLFDMSDDGGGMLKNLLKSFKHAIREVFNEEEGADVKYELLELEDILKKMYNWNVGDNIVTNGQLELEDGETVEMDLRGYDEEHECGEYAPVIVDLQE